MLKLLMLWPKPSNVPVNLVLGLPTGTKPALPQTSLLLPVARALMLLPRV